MQTFSLKDMNVRELMKVYEVNMCVRISWMRMSAFSVPINTRLYGS